MLIQENCKDCKLNPLNFRNLGNRNNLRANLIGISNSSSNPYLNKKINFLLFF